MRVIEALKAETAFRPVNKTEKTSQNVKVNRRNRKKVPVANYLQGPPPPLALQVSSLSCPAAGSLVQKNLKKVPKRSIVIALITLAMTPMTPIDPQIIITDRNTKRHSRSDHPLLLQTPFRLVSPQRSPKMTPRRCLFALLHPHDEQRRLASSECACAPLCAPLRNARRRGVLQSV